MMTMIRSSFGLKRFCAHVLPRCRSVAELNRICVKVLVEQHYDAYYSYYYGYYAYYHA